MDDVQSGPRQGCAIRRRSRATRTPDSRGRREDVCRARLGAGPVLAALLLFGGAGAASDGDAARSFLASAFDVTAAELARVNRGHVVARTMTASDSREVATLGIVQLKITPEFYVRRLADIASFKRDEAILQIGTFGSPPHVRDVSGLTLDEPDLRSLRGCRVGNCGVQLSAGAIERFRTEVDWKRADAEGQANELMRRILVEYVTDYVNAGTSASMTYADKPQALDLGREFVLLARPAAGGWKQFPALHRHLMEYPSERAPRTTDLLYWSKEKVGRRGVASVTHLAIAATAADSVAEYAIASKHIYGTHYYDASLGLTVLVRDRAAPAPSTYLVYVNRSRVDVFGGPFGGVTRRIVSSRARATVSHQLGRMQGTLERQFATSSFR